MTVYHTKDICWKYCEETNFAGGYGGAAYTPTAPTNAQLTACHYPFNEAQTMPWQEYDNQMTEAAGQAISTKVPFTQGLIPIEGVLIQYMQTDDWLDWAAGINPVETGGGALPKSRCLHFKIHGVEYNAYGCRATKYRLETKSNSFMKETVNLIPYSVVAATATSWANAWDTTAVATHKDFGSTTFTIDTIPITDVAEAWLEITNHYHDELGHGVYNHKFPYLLKRDFEFHVKCATFEADHILNNYTTVADPCELVVNPFGKTLVTMTNMTTKVGSTNINEVPSKGLKVYEMTFEIGGASALTT